MPIVKQSFNGGTVTGATDIVVNGDAVGAGALVVQNTAGTGNWDPFTVLNEHGDNIFDVNTGLATLSDNVSVQPFLSVTQTAAYAARTTIGRYTNQNNSAVIEMRSTGAVYANGGFFTGAITSGALPTVSPVSGAAFQCSTTRDVFLTVPFTLTTAAGTCKVELSPDNLTFSTLVTLTPAVNAAVAAAQVVVPAGWRVKLTVTNATLGAGTYY